jgi:16S rRNA (uracil1498-N3)-methyltransferase
VERWRRIARESSQQSRRTHMPEVADPIRLSQLRVEPFTLRYVLDEEATQPVLQAFPAERSREDRVCLLAGPEGGWSETERQRLLADWTPVSLGTQILRTETASLAALAIVIAAWTR